MQTPTENPIMAMGEPAVPHMLRHWRDRGGIWQHALSAVTGVHITKGVTELRDANYNAIKGWVDADYPTLRTAWLKWGVENGHIDTIESVPQPMRDGYVMRRYGFCSDDECQDVRERVFQCPCCTETFCNQCMDTPRWERESPAACPRCGWNPEEMPLIQNDLLQSP